MWVENFVKRMSISTNSKLRTNLVAAYRKGQSFRTGNFESVQNLKLNAKTKTNELIIVINYFTRKKYVYVKGISQTIRVIVNYFGKLLVSGKSGVQC